MWYFNIADCGMLSIFGHAVEKTLKKLIFVMVVQPWLHKYNNFLYENSTFHDFLQDSMEDHAIVSYIFGTAPLSATNWTIVLVC